MIVYYQLMYKTFVIECMIVQFYIEIIIGVDLIQFMYV